MTRVNFDRGRVSLERPRIGNSKKIQEGDMVTVIVTLDNSGKSPRLIFNPEVAEVTGKTETIIWTAQGDFTFAALAFDHPNPFSNIIVQDASITAVDSNEKSEYHKYSVLYQVGGQYYSSKGGLFQNGGPTIRNR